MQTLPSWLLYLLLAPFVGSFLGVVIARAQTPRAIAFGRSCCPACAARLAPADLAPIASWVVLRGRCRHCGNPISAFYPLIELGAVAIALWAVLAVSAPLLFPSCLLGWTLLALAVIDFKLFLLPDFLTVPLFAAGLIVTRLVDPDALLLHIAGAAAGFTLVVAIRSLYWIVRHREGMGLGDAKLLAAAGAWVSLEGLPSVILIGSVAALAFALLTALRSNRISLTDRVPFGAFLAAGTWTVWLCGPLLIDRNGESFF